MPKSSTYAFSFTAATLKFYDFMRVVSYVMEHNLDLSKEKINSEAALGKEKARTNQRETRELLKRYTVLTKEEQELLYNSDSKTQRQLALVGICKAYLFIRDFIIEVLREKFLVFDFELTDSDYRTFVNRKRDQHPELDLFAESTQKKVKQHTFKILEEAGLINSIKERIIQPQVLQESLIFTLISDNPELLKLFLMSDSDIKKLMTHA